MKLTGFHTNETQPNKRIRIRSVAAFVLSLLIAAVFVRASIGVPEQGFEDRFDSILPGTMIDELLTSLGSPDYRGAEFHLSQLRGFENIYKSAESSGAVEFLSWSRNIDMTYTIGVDANGRTIFKAKGGT